MSIFCKFYILIWKIRKNKIQQHVLVKVTFKQQVFVLYPILCDRTRKGFNERDVVPNAWNN